MQLLKRDHNAVKRLFTELNRTTGRAVKKRQQLVQKIGSELEAHATIEEEIFYPAMAELDRARELLNEAREEHGHVKEMLAEIRGLAPDDAQLVGRMKELRQSVVHHATEEEREMFPLAEQLGNDRLRELAGALEARKSALMGAAMPGKRTRRAA
ncbi:MAG: hemerythrin domain-containing protein [Candidatus Rokubacteria bacterium]|nr:hemerythrin domain-containing protein [Candidatus Rokubacteria bacterium]